MILLIHLTSIKSDLPRSGAIATASHPATPCASAADHGIAAMSWSMSGARGGLQKANGHDTLSNNIAGLDPK
jgi:hypothetical protein